MRYMIMIVLMFVFNACVPMTYLIIPEIKGVVIDKKTKKPLSGVYVDDIKTDKSGKFFFKAQTEIRLASLMGGVWPISGRMIRVSKKGYGTQYYYCNPNKKGCRDIVIELEKGKKEIIINPKGTKIDRPYYMRVILDKRDFNETIK